MLKLQNFMNEQSGGKKAEDQGKNKQKTRAPGKF